MATNTKNLELLKHKSAEVSLGPDRAPARSMLRAVGLDDEDMEKPFIAVANLASDVTPCNVHLTRIAEKVKEGIKDAQGVPFMFGTITISDGISMGTEGMKGSLVSREVIAVSSSCLRQKYARCHDVNGTSKHTICLCLWRCNSSW